MDEINSENDETIQLKNVENIEEVIIDGILSIRKSYARPSYITILSYVNNGEEFNLNMQSLKRIMKDMMDMGTIHVKGKRGQESFYVSDKCSNETIIPDNTEDVDDVTNVLEKIMNDELYKHLVNKVESGVISHITENKSLSLNLEHKFNLLSAEFDNKCNSLCIKLEDKINSLNLKVNDIDLNNNKIINDNDENLNAKINSKLTTDDSSHDINSNYDYKNDVLITTLKDEIKFLRNELRSKDKIIELIVKELPVGYKSVSPNESNEYDYKTSNKKTKVKSSNNTNNTLALNNRFTPLVCDNENDDVSEVRSDTRATIHTAAKKPPKQQKSNEKKSNLKRQVINFIGDSILKDMNPYNLKHKIKKTDKLYIQSYRGARTSSMKYHAKASQQFQSDIYVLHCGTNDLKLEKSAEDIATDILEIGDDLKSEGNMVFISSILTRRDDLDEKGKKVNHFLSLHCPNYSLGYIDNNDIITNRHLNKSGLHLNKDGTRLLSENFLTVINN